jgi:hypothetical protein
MPSKRCASFNQDQSAKINVPSASKSVHNWRELYMAALFETDNLELPSRIAEAERALILRARELFVMSNNNSEEGKAVDKGLYALRALRNCLKLKTGEPEAA